MVNSVLRVFLVKNSLTIIRKYLKSFSFDSIRRAVFDTVVYCRGLLVDDYYYSPMTGMSASALSAAQVESCQRYKPKAGIAVSVSMLEIKSHQHK